MYFFEKRDESGLPKGKFAEELIKKIDIEGDKLIFSDVVRDEMMKLSYMMYEIELLLSPLKKNLIYIRFGQKQFGRAKDTSKKRAILLLDALHALIARDCRAIMVTRDWHFKKLLDILSYKKPEELI